MIKRVLIFTILFAASAFAQAPEIFAYRDNTDTNYPWTGRYESRRFVIRYSENASDNASINQQTADAALAGLEDAYDKLVHEFGFHPAHAPNDQSKYKCEVIILRPSGPNYMDGGYGFGGLTNTPPRSPIMWVSTDAVKQKTVLTHELTHGLQQQSGGFQQPYQEHGQFVGWLHESHANFMTNQVYNTVDGATESYVRTAHIHLGYTRTRYNNWLFLEYFHDKFGMDFINRLWTESYKGGNSQTARDNQADADPFSELMRIHDISQKEFGDMIGDFAMKNVIFDYERKAMFRSAYNNNPPEKRRRMRYTYLEALDSTDGENGRFVSPFYMSPQRYGYNIIRLYPDETGAVTVRFRGDVQTKNNDANYTKKLALEPSVRHVFDDPGSDWRYGLVAVKGQALSTSASVTARYSEVMRASDGNPDVSIQLESGEDELYLVVAATPTVNHKITWDQFYYTIYRFPYMVQIIGAKPDGFQAVDSTGLSRRTNPDGSIGGFVSSTSTVAATAYVGANARVLGTARVRDNARIEGRAVVRGGTVSGSAVVRDYAMVVNGTISGNAEISEGAIIWNGQVYENGKVHGLAYVDNQNAKIYGSAQMGGASSTVAAIDLSGTAQFLGDGDGDITASVGVYYGNISSASASDNAQGADRLVPPTEFTAPRTLAWYGVGDDPPAAAARVVTAKRGASAFRFDGRGNLRYDLGGAKSATLKVFDSRGRQLTSMRLDGNQNVVNTNLRAAAQMLLWKVEIDGKVAGRGRMRLVRG